MKHLMKKTLVMAALFFLTTAGFSQSLYGFLNYKGEEVIPAKFEFVGDFFNGLAAAQLNGKWGYINKKGEFVVQPIYGYALSFKDGFGVVKEQPNSVYSIYVNTEGKLFSEYEFLKALPYFDGLKAIKIGDKFGFKDEKDKVVIDAIYEKVTNFNGSGLARVTLNGKHGIINKLGKVICPIEYGYISEFKGGYFGVRSSTYECVIYDSTGKNKKLNDVEYVAGSLDYNGLFFYKSNGKEGFLNKNGDVVIPATYDWARSGNNNIVTVKLNGTVSVINILEPQKIVSSFVPSNQDAYFTFINGLSKSYNSRTGKGGFTDINGNTVSPFNNEAFSFKGFLEELYIFEKDNSTNTYASNSSTSNVTSTSTTTNNAPSASTTTTSGNISSSSYALDLFSDLGSMALYVGSTMYIVKIKGSNMLDIASTAARAAQVVNITSNYKYEWFSGKNCITLKNKYSSLFTTICRGEIDLRK